MSEKEPAAASPDPKAAAKPPPEGPGAAEPPPERPGAARPPPDRPGAAKPPPDRPPPTFSLLCASLAAQVQVSLGLVANPMTGATARDLAAAKHGIDLLDVLDAKTKGNLDEREATLLSHVLYDLRMAYVEVLRRG